MGEEGFEPSTFRLSAGRMLLKVPTRLSYPPIRKISEKEKDKAYQIYYANKIYGNHRFSRNTTAHSLDDNLRCCLDDRDNGMGNLHGQQNL